MTVEKVIDKQVENIVNIIGDVVAAVRDEYDPENGEMPYYLHGHPQEIINTLIEKTADEELKFKKYPLIALFEDFVAASPEGLFKSKAKLTLVIMTDTSRDYKADQRYTNSFDVILTPVYDLFMKHLRKSRRVQKIRQDIKHERINHLYWGKKGLFGNVGNMGTDFIDAIEIKDLDIKVYRD